jgi:hypothetical protein
MGEWRDPARIQPADTPTTIQQRRFDFQTRFDAGVGCQKRAEMRVFLLTLDPRMRAASPKPGSASMPTCRKRVCIACIHQKEASQKTQGKQSPWHPRLRLGENK